MPGSSRILSAVCLLAMGCTARGFAPGRLDGAAAPGDAGVDGASIDAGPADAFVADGGPIDGSSDARVEDAWLPDAPIDAGPCPAGTSRAELFAVHPAVAEEGQPVWLEGSFTTGGLVTATFPSGVTAEVCAASDHRVMLRVPTGAGAGRISVGPGAATAFRATSFHPALGPFLPDYDQTAFARGMPRLSSARASAVAVVTPLAVYAIGGDTALEMQSRTVETFRVHADGTLGPPEASMIRLGSGRAGAAGVTLGKYFCVFGGEGGSGLLASIECAPPSTTLVRLGIDPFSPASVDAPEARRDAAAVVVGDHLYVLGGRGAGGPGTTTVMRLALTAADPPIGVWETVPGLTLDPHFAASTAAVIGESVYVLGDGSYAVFPIDADGALGSPTLGALARPIERATAVEIGRAAYFVGSLGGDVATADAAGITLSSRHGSAYASRPMVVLVGDQLHVIGDTRTERASVVASESQIQLGTDVAATGLPLVVGDQLLLVPRIGGTGTTTQTFDASGALVGASTLAGLSFPAGSGSLVSTPAGGVGTVAAAELVTWLGGSDPCAAAAQRTYTVTDAGLVATSTPVFAPVPTADAFLRFSGGTLLEIEPLDTTCARSTALWRAFGTTVLPYGATPLSASAVSASRSATAFVDDAARVVVGTELVGTTNGMNLGAAGLPADLASAVYLLGTRVHLLGLAGDRCASGDVGGAFAFEACPSDLRGSPTAALVVGNYVHVVTTTQTFSYLIR